ncbi:MAG TPA: ABC transporter permease [Alphaproteobacteria bacterium]|nr:ABC transporter permease [Alphaproteobacteria bacterium]
MTPDILLPRLLQAFLTLLILSFLVYTLIGLMPGDPVDLMIAGNPNMTAEDAARLREIHGLDRPLLLRYGSWLTSAAAGDLGYSRLYGLPVLEVIGPRVMNTVLLMGISLLLTVAVAVPLGVFAACRKNRAADRIIGFFCLAGISLPAFWLGLLLMALFSVKLGWLPAGAALESADVKTRALSMVMPVMTLTLAGMAIYIRHLRSAMIDALRADHIRTARAKGCSEPRVVWHHAFRAALPPLVTIFMLDLGTLVGGAMTVETVFAWPGMGKLMFDAVMGNDYNLALCGFLVLAACVLAANMLADILYTVLDARVAAGGKA